MPLIKEKSPHVRLCIVNPTRTTTNSVPGVISDEAREMATKVASVHVIVFGTGRPNVIKLSHNALLHTVPFQMPENHLRFPTFAIGQLRTFSIVLKVVLRSDVNLIRADDPILTGLVAAVISKSCRLPFVLFLGGNPAEIARVKLRFSNTRVVQRTLMLSLIRLLQRIVIRLSDLVITVNEELAAMSQQLGAKQVLIVEPYLDLRKFVPAAKPEGRRFRVMYVGRLEPEKGILDLLAAARSLASENIEFVIAGGGSLAPALNFATRSQADLSKVRLLGPVNHDAMPELYHQADVVVLPSYTEGAPVAVFEAMASGCPVVATRVGNLPTLFRDEVEIMFVATADPQDLASKLRTLCVNDNLRKELVRNAWLKTSNLFGSYLEAHIKSYSRLISAMR